MNFGSEATGRASWWLQTVPEDAGRRRERTSREKTAGEYKKFRHFRGASRNGKMALLAVAFCSEVVSFAKANIIVAEVGL